MNHTSFFDTGDPALNYVTTHVFLPIQVPKECDYTIENDLSLARAVCKAAHAYSVHISDAIMPRWHSIQKMLDNLQVSVQFGQLRRGDVLSQLGTMQPGDTLVFLVAAQYAAVIFRRQENHTLYESFAVSPSRDALVSTLGSLIYSYSDSAIEVPNDIFDDGHFQIELVDFLSRPGEIHSDLPIVPASHPGYLTTLLNGILRSVGRGVQNRGILKRIRDEIGESQRKENEWRRSSLWLLIRVAIQTSLDRSPLGHVLYKTFMLFFVCNLAKDAHNAGLSSDLLHLMSTKILRRLTKLGPSTPHQLCGFALKTCACLQDTLEVRAMEVHASHSKSLRWSPSELDLVNDTWFSLVHSSEYIRNALACNAQRPLDTSSHLKSYLRGTLEDFLSNVSFFDQAYNADPYVALYDVERSVEEGIDDWTAHVVDVGEACLQLGSLMEVYMSSASIPYRDNPEYRSIMTLTALELWVALDKLVVAEMPILAEYSPEIPIWLLESLLLRQTTNLHRLSRIYQYLSARYSRSRTGLSVISDEFTQDSFPARYYDGSFALQTFRVQFENGAMWRTTEGGDGGATSLALTLRGVIFRPKGQGAPGRQLGESTEDSQSLLHILPLHAKIITFELQCPLPFGIWRSSVVHLLYRFDNDRIKSFSIEPGSKSHEFLHDIPEFQPYLLKHMCQGSPTYSQFHLAYFHPRSLGSHESPRLGYAFKWTLPRYEYSRWYGAGHGPLSQHTTYYNFFATCKEDAGERIELARYVGTTTHTSNDVISSQTDCPLDFSLDEFIALGHLRSGSSLQWINILRELRSGTLNFRSQEVHFLLTQAICQVGPLDKDTGVWAWHQELQNLSFCDALLDELKYLFSNAAAGSLDHVTMHTISLLLSRVVASSPCESVSERALQLLRNVRVKTLEWVQELAYNLILAPMSDERRVSLHNMAVTCRSTFDVSTSVLCKPFLSAQDVDALLSSAFFMQATSPGVPHQRPPTGKDADCLLCHSTSSDIRDHSELLHQQYRRLSITLEGMLKGAIRADVSDRGIDLAVRNIWPGYRQGPQRWEPVQHRNSHQLACPTAASADREPRLMHVDLVDESLLADGQALGGLPYEIREHPLYKKFLCGQALVITPSDLSGMDFATLAIVSNHRIHFSLRGEDLVVRAQCQDTGVVLELIPPEKLKGDLPTFLVQDHVHWLNPSESDIEIRPIKQLWEQSSETWRIAIGPDGGYHVRKGCESLVDMKSKTWTMVSALLDCLDLPGNLVVTTRTSTQSVLPTAFKSLSVDLPYHSLSFFLNADGELESRDFKNMIYDHDQCVGTLFGLRNRIVLRARGETGGLTQRCILVPHDAFERRNTPRSSFSHNWATYSAYKVDGELGCLTGDSTYRSKAFLAYLHAKTSIDWKPDPLTGRTGGQEALSIIQSAGLRSFSNIRGPSAYMFPSEEDSEDIFPRFPHIDFELSLQERRWYHMHPESDDPTFPFRQRRHVARRLRGARRAAHLFLGNPFNPTAEDCGKTDLVPLILEPDLEGDVYTTALAIFCQPINMKIISDWTSIWDDIMRGSTSHPPSPYDGMLWNPSLLEALSNKVHDILRVQEGNDDTRSKFQLLFLLPAVAYCSSHPQVAFLSMLLGLVKSRRSPWPDPSRYTDHNFLDGYVPTEKILRHHIHASLRLNQVWPDEDSIPECVCAAVECLLRAWPSDTVPTFSLDLESDLWDVTSLTRTLRELFSSCYRNLKLKESITCFLQESFGVSPAKSSVSGIRTIPDRHTRKPNLPSIPSPDLPQPVRYTSKPWRVKLEQLFNWPAPTLPDLVKLPPYDSQKVRCSPSAAPALDRLYPSLRTKKSDHPFQEQYITHLHASARYVYEEHQMIGGTKSYSIEKLKGHFLQCRSRCIDAFRILKERLSPVNDPLQQALGRSGLWPQITPYTLLQCLATTSPIKLPGSWTECLVSFALLLLELQRSRRLLQFCLEGLEEELSKELENGVCDGWTAEQFPDWLLIQLQGNFLIRRTQVDIAMEMISPQSGQSTVMQVNMGEGKSSVIIPITAAALAEGHQLVRVVVPKTLMTQMFQLLADRLGGLANRPIYHLRFSRQDIDPSDLDQLYEDFRECTRKHGVFIVQPEDVISLKLSSVEMQLPRHKLLATASSKPRSIYDSQVAILSLKSLKGSYLANLLQWICDSLKHSTSKQDISTLNDCQESARAFSDSGASKFLNLQKWLYSHSRDILDECDEVLHPRFQLVYTIGYNQHMDGYPDRWTIIQQVLRLVKRHASALSKNLPDSVEYALGQPGSFPYFRILQTSDAGRRLILLLLNDVMSGHLPAFSFRNMGQMQQNVIHEFLSSENVQLDKAKEVEEYAKRSQQGSLWGGLLLLRGLFACNLLLFALTERRWRVDYGLAFSPSWEPTTLTQLAVPYRAKDAPAPETQFGHPDVIIILTCLCCYYTGLSEAQLRVSFQILLDEDNPAAEYARWVQDCGFAVVPPSLQHLWEFNLESSEQWDKYLYPIFSRSQVAIDFYLSRVVFPKEAKEFPGKLVGSSWDLAETKQHPITGFSGTNDSRYLLPISVTQRDLDHQQGTNARMLGYLLQPENDSYALIAHKDSKSSKTSKFLKTVVDQIPEIRVLLDVGAQILDVSNHELAEEWLALCGSVVVGAVYFDGSRDEWRVLTRNCISVPLDTSPLSQQLDRCVIYVDDAHTRGTDLRFPSGFRAAVTLGPKVTKDRLVQGCMRMRKLGHGHSIMFFAPLEVELSIRSVTQKEDPNICITSADILRWAIHETLSDIQQRAPYWAQQGLGHETRYEAWSRYCSAELTSDQLADAWVQPDMKSLADLYAPREGGRSSNTPPSELEKHIGRHCEYLGVGKSLNRVAQLDEELEREVSREIEREREVELPPRAEPANHFLHPDVTAFVNTGKLRASSAFRPVFTALDNSSAATREARAWSPFILATADFCDTIKHIPSGGRVDQYLRPVQWVLSGRKGQDRVLVLLSPFEADGLMPDIRVSNHVHLHVYVPRTTERMKPTDDLKFYSIPPIPDDWIPPWDLIDQLNIFAGQLYLRDHESYVRLCNFLDVQKKAQEDRTHRTQRAKWRNLFNRSSRRELGEAHPVSLLPSVMILLAIRRRGLPFSETHMGKLLQGESLTEANFTSKSPTLTQPSISSSVMS